MAERCRQTAFGWPLRGQDESTLAKLGRLGLGSEQPEGSGPEATLGPTFSGGSLQFGSINAFSCRHASQSETGGRPGYSAHLQHPS